MKYASIVFLLTILSITWACSNRNAFPRFHFHFDTILRHTPISNQGERQTCWVYAGISFVESEALRRDDSLHLSSTYLERCIYEAEFDSVAKGGSEAKLRGTGASFFHFFDIFGTVLMKNYRKDVCVDSKKMTKMLRRCVKEKSKNMWQAILDTCYAPKPPFIQLYGVCYSPPELGGSMLIGKKAEGYTSLANFKENMDVTLDIPDNRENAKFRNLRLNKLINLMVESLKRGHSILWEGDISEPTFSAEEGVAFWKKDDEVSENKRLQDIENGSTTDDHVMHIVGLAHTNKGERFFLAKNSWGAIGRFKGYVMLSENYIRMKTMCIYLVKD